VATLGVHEYPGSIEQQGTASHALRGQPDIQGEIIEHVFEGSPHRAPYKTVNRVARRRTLERLNRSRFEDRLAEIIEVVVKRHPDIEWSHLGCL